MIEEKLHLQKELSRYRKLLIYSEPLNFCSNDYLGLSKHPLLIKRSQEWTEKYGIGATGSRLVSGNHLYHEKVEKKLAELLEVESVLLFNTGFQANFSVISTLMGRNSVIFGDRLLHNSLLLGAKNGKLYRYPHLNIKKLEELLKSKPASQKMVVTETLFSMDGDIPDLEKIANIAKKYEAILYLDDSHAFGVLGVKGLGLAKEVYPDIIMSGFGKGIGCFGAFIASSQKIREYLINFCPGLIYSTALPPGVLGAIDAAIDIFPSMEKERQELKRKAEYFNVLEKKSNTHIISVVIGDEEKTLKIAKLLKEEGILVFPSRPPTVPKGTSRLRISLTIKHTKEDIEKLINRLLFYI